MDLSPDETNRERVLDASNDNAILCGTRSSGSVVDASRRLVFVGRDSAAARAIQAALQQRALAVRLETGASRQSHAVQQRFTDAMRSAAARAAGSAVVELDGRRLSVALKLAPNSAERQAMAALLDARAARAKEAAEVVLGLAEGKLPSAERLQSFQPKTARLN